MLLITLACCGLFFRHPSWFPIPVTTDAILFDAQFQRTLLVTAVIFVAVQVLLAVAIIRRPGNTRPRITKQGPVEIAWTAATTALFLALAFMGSRTWAKVPTRATSDEVIEVYSRQFAWHFRYPGADNRFGVTGTKFINDAAGNPFGLDPADKAGDDDIVAASLRIPAGRDVLLLLHSRDVIHDFFVRELRTKQDVVPGMEIPLRIHVDHPGQYEIACAELCGQSHSQMRSFLIVMPPAEYEEWKRRAKT